MTLQTVPGGLWIPTLIGIGNTMDLSQETVLDASGDAAGYAFGLPKAGTIDGCSFRTNTVTTGATVTVELQTLDASGDPSGTLYHANATATQVVDDTDDDTVFVVSWTGFTVPAADVGKPVVIVVRATTAINMQITKNRTLYNALKFPYLVSNTTSSWVKETATGVHGLRYSTGFESVFGMFPADAITAVLFNNTSTPDERGLIFQVPFPGRVIGAWVRLEVGAGEDFEIVFYDGTTEQMTHVHDGDEVQSTGDGEYVVFFDGSFDVVANTDYRIVVKPTTTTSLKLAEVDAALVAHMAGFPAGSNFRFTSRVDAGSWDSTVTTRWPVMGVIFSGFDDATGGGGGTDSILGAGGLHGGFA